MSTLHITNGDDAAGKLRRIVHDPVTIMADVLHDGPCPPLEGDAWHQVRAEFIASGSDATPAGVKATLERWDRTITDACERRDEIVLWFEHDLFDQLALIRTLDLMVRPKPDTPEQRISPRASLICIDRFPGIDRFVGLGQLTPTQLATLIGTQVAVTAGHVALATDTWRAFRSPDPAELLEIVEQLTAADTPVSEGGPALPFLGDALLRFLADYPSVANGLSRTEELALQALVAGPATAGALFAAAQSGEARPFMGDATFSGILQRLASGRVPLVIVDSGPDEVDLRTNRIAITNAGRDVLAQRADMIRLNGIDLWRGGVHLTGSDRSPWRWDAATETLVS